MKQLITMLLMSAILLGCSKSTTEDEYQTISGTVLEFDDNTPMEAIPLSLKKQGRIIKEFTQPNQITLTQ